MVESTRNRSALVAWLKRTKTLFAAESDNSYPSVVPKIALFRRDWVAIFSGRIHVAIVIALVMSRPALSATVA